MKTLIFLMLMAGPALAGKVSPEALALQLKALPPQLTLLGEVHDNPTHHATQALAVAALAPKALVFEMLTPAQAARATPEARRSKAALEAALGWENWPDFALYWPIFAAAPEAEIVGAALPREALEAAMVEGAAAVFGPQAASYGLTAPFEDRSAQMVAAHCGKLPLEAARAMAEVQRLKDASFARTALKTLEKTGGPVAVIAGSEHVRKDVGLPYYLRWAAPDVRQLSVVQLEEGQSPPDLHDLWISAPAATREDPCAALKAP